MQHTGVFSCAVVPWPVASTPRVPTKIKAREEDFGYLDVRGMEGRLTVMFSMSWCLPPPLIARQRELLRQGGEAVEGHDDLVHKR